MKGRNMEGKAATLFGLVSLIILSFLGTAILRKIKDDILNELKK